MSESERARRLVLSLIGTDLAPYKENVVSRRIRVRAVETGFQSVTRYLESLESEGDEARAEAHRLVGGLCPKVSGFFRDPEVFDALESLVYPVLSRNRARGDPIRVWSAACARGQEAYSLAISLTRFLLRTGTGTRLSVLGTDLDDEAVAAARAGVYTPRELEGAPPWVSADALDPAPGGGFAVRPEIRALVRFRAGDLLDFPTHPRGLDFVACRNILIYLRRSVQEDLILALRRALRPGGFLLLGMSETVLGRPWKALDHVGPVWRIYRRAETGDP